MFPPEKQILSSGEDLGEAFDKPVSTIINESPFILRGFS